MIIILYNYIHNIEERYNSVTMLNTAVYKASVIVLSDKENNNAV